MYTLRLLRVWAGIPDAANMKFVTPFFLILHALLPLAFTLETGSNATQLQTLEQLLPACSVSFVVVPKHMGQ